MSTPPASTGSGGSPEFTWEWAYGRGCWVIWRHGQPYLEIERHPRKYPGHTEAYVRRVVAKLNGESHSR